MRLISACLVDWMALNPNGFISFQNSAFIILNLQRKKYTLLRTAFWSSWLNAGEKVRILFLKIGVALAILRQLGYSSPCLKDKSMIGERRSDGRFWFFFFFFSG